MSELKLSVITVCRNNLDGLKKTCASVLAQDYKDFEWLIVDGASTDGTVDYLKNINCDKLKWISEPDRGIYDAMNKGLAMARGERVLFLNSGDAFAAPDVLSRLLSRPSDADVVYGDVNLVWTNKTIHFPGLDKPTVDSLWNTSLPHPASAILRETLLAYGGYDTGYKIVSDWKFWMQLAKGTGTFEHRSVTVADFAKDGISTQQNDLRMYELERIKHELFGAVKLSVVVPVYNVEDYIRECLDSILSQDVVLEVICVDDNSTDGSAAICEEYAAKHSNVTLVRNKTNIFAGPCRNIGIDLAKGEYIAFVDSDDRVESGAYRKLVNVADMEKLEVVRGIARIFDATTGEFIDEPYWQQTRFRGPAKEGKIVDYKDVVEDLVGVLCVPFTGICRRDLLINSNVRYNSLRCSNDISFFIEMMLKASRVKFVWESVVQYRVNNSKSLVGVRTKHYRDVLSCGFDILNRIKDYDAEIRRKVLNYTFNAYPHWLDTAVSQSDAERQAQIKADYREFFLKLDKSPWAGKMHDTYWCKVLEERLGPEPFEESKPLLLSVIVPVYNAAKYLEECFESLSVSASAIGGDNVEIIAVDDGSTDESLEVLKRLAEKYGANFAKIRVLHQENSGQGAARNRALKLATGQYIYYMDADDKLTADMFKIVVPKMQKERLDVLMFSAEPFADEPGMEARIAGHKRYYNIDESVCNKVVTGIDLARMMFAIGDVQVSPPLRVYNRIFALKNKLFFPEGIVHEDYAIGHIALWSASRVMALPNKFYLRRETSSSTTGDPKNIQRRIAGYVKNGEMVSQFAEARKVEAGILLRVFCEITGALLGMKKVHNICEKYDPILRGFHQSSKVVLANSKRCESKLQQAYGWLDEVKAGSKRYKDKLQQAYGRLDEIKAGNSSTRIRSLEREKKLLKREVNNLKSSISYRIGMVITWPARKIWRAFRDNSKVDAWFKRHKR